MSDEGYFWHLFNPPEVRIRQEPGDSETLGECLFAKWINIEVALDLQTDTHERCNMIKSIIRELKEIE